MQEDPDRRPRFPKASRALPLVLLASLVALGLGIRRGLTAGWTPTLTATVLGLALVTYLLLEAYRMLRAWRREVEAEREARESRQRRLDGSDASREDSLASQQGRAGER